MWTYHRLANPTLALSSHLKTCRQVIPRSADILHRYAFITGTDLMLSFNRFWIEHLNELATRCGDKCAVFYEKLRVCGYLRFSQRSVPKQQIARLEHTVVSV